MLTKLKQSKGFTIIEVMIVLAIAGLIILIVLLAVPALQRNGRNAAIKNDASAILAGFSTFATDNDGKAIKLIADIDETTTPGTVKLGAATTSHAEVKVQSGDTFIKKVATVPTAKIDPGTIYINLQMTCNAEPSSRAISVWYSIETSKVPTASPWNNKCLDG
jgi:prepilin-type N-terminal cleavage/methylation domain-containing protein